MGRWGARQPIDLLDPRGWKPTLTKSSWGSFGVAQDDGSIFIVRGLVFGRAMVALGDDEDYAGFGGVVPGFGYMAQGDGSGIDLEFGGGEGFEDVFDGGEEARHGNAFEATTHEDDGRGAKGCAGEGDVCAAGAADLDEADGGCVFNGLGDGGDDDFGGLAPEVVDDYVDAVGELFF